MCVVSIYHLFLTSQRLFARHYRHEVQDRKKNERTSPQDVQDIHASDVSSRRFTYPDLHLVSVCCFVDCRPFPSRTARHDDRKNVNQCVQSQNPVEDAKLVELCRSHHVQFMDPPLLTRPEVHFVRTERWCFVQRHLLTTSVGNRLGRISQFRDELDELKKSIYQ